MGVFASSAINAAKLLLCIHISQLRFTNPKARFAKLDRILWTDISCVGCAWVTDPPPPAPFVWSWNLVSALWIREIPETQLCHVNPRMSLSYVTLRMVLYKIINSHQYIALIVTILHTHLIAREFLSFFQPDSATGYTANNLPPCLRNILVTE